MDSVRRSEDLLRTISAPDRLIEQLEALTEVATGAHQPEIQTGSVVVQFPEASDRICQDTIV